jgi:putative ABC transport system permease protein
MVREWPGEEATVGRPLLVAGRAPHPAETDGIVLDRNAAAAYDVDVGDVIGILTPVGRQDVTVIGLSVSAELCPYPSCFPIPHYLTQEGMLELGLLPTHEPDMGSLDIGLRLGDQEDPEAVVQEVEDVLPAGSIRGWFTWEEMHRYADAAIDEPRILLITFGIVAGLAAGFLIANAVSGAVLGQTRQIGLLKAIGFTRRQLAAGYILEYIGLALIASLIGLVAGGLTAWAALRNLAAQFGETTIRIPLWIALATPVSTIILSTLFILIPVRRASRLSVVETIRSGAERERWRSARLLRIPLPLALGVSDTLSHPLRSMLVALALGMAVLTLIAGQLLSSTLHALMIDPAMGGIRDGDLLLERSVYLSDGEVRELIESQSVVVHSYAERWGSFRFPGEEQALSARFREGDLGLFEFALVEGWMVENPGEIVVGYALAEERGLQVRDSLNVLVAGEAVTLEVVGIYREGTNLGRMAVLSIDLLRCLDANAEPYTYVLRLDPGADKNEIASGLELASEYQLEVTVMEEIEMPDWLVSLETTMLVLSFVLAAIGGFGVLSSVWTSVRVRQRELALLKAVGMTPVQMTLSVIMGMSLVALVGYAVGLPAGVLGIRFLIDQVSRGMGFGPVHSPLNVAGLLLVLPVIVFVTVVGAYVPAWRAGRLSVVDAIRYE